ncbi:hypothetical protein M8J75_008164 [Diaphorina citri]|nr:hypothetical protein M8J75_008164 [Diaphorina citri]
MMRSSDQTIYKSVPNTTRYGLRESRYEIKEKRQRRGLSSSLALVRTKCENMSKPHKQIIGQYQTRYNLDSYGPVLAKHSSHI